MNTSGRPDTIEPVQLDYEACLEDFVQTRRWEEDADRYFARHATLEVNKSVQSGCVATINMFGPRHSKTSANFVRGIGHHLWYDRHAARRGKPLFELANERRGTFDHLEYLSEERVLLTYELPLAEIVYDFYDQLKSRTRGYASFDYDLAGFRPGDLTRVDILVAGSAVFRADDPAAAGRAILAEAQKGLSR